MQSGLGVKVEVRLAVNLVVVLFFNEVVEQRVVEQAGWKRAGLNDASQRGASRIEFEPGSGSERDRPRSPE